MPQGLLSFTISFLPYRVLLGHCFISHELWRLKPSVTKLEAILRAKTYHCAPLSPLSIDISTGMTQAQTLKFSSCHSHTCTRPALTNASPIVYSNCQRLNAAGGKVHSSSMSSGPSSDPVPYIPGLEGLKEAVTPLIWPCAKHSTLCSILYNGFT